MSLRRGLQPKAGVLLFIGTGCAFVAFGDTYSSARRRLRSYAAEERRTLLAQVLSRRLRQTAQPRRDYATSTLERAPLNSKAKSVPEDNEDPCAAHLLEIAAGRHFHVVTGPDEYLTFLACDRLDRVLRRGEAHEPPAYPSVVPVRLVVPHDCVFGSGCFASLVEQKLLHTGDQLPPRFEQHHVPEDGALQPEQDKERNVSAQQGIGADASATGWELLMLRATRVVLDERQLDADALWALETVLSGLVDDRPPTAHREAHQTGSFPPSTGGRESGTRVDGKTVAGGRAADDSYGTEQASPAGRSADGNHDSAGLTTDHSRANYFPLQQDYHPSLTLQVCVNSRKSQTWDGEDSTKAQVEQESNGEFTRWGWGLAYRRLARVIFSSSNPWILAELQRELQPGRGLSLQSREGPEEHSNVIIEAFDKDGPPGAVANEVVLTRVVLPSGREREQAVASVADELGLKEALSPEEVAMVADLTGGRRPALRALMKQLKSSPDATLADACQAAIDEEALALATMWGLLPEEQEDEAGDRGLIQSSNAMRNFLSSGERRAGGGPHTTEELSALFEVLRVLSMPAVSIGAGPSTGLAPPRGSMAPANLQRECDLSSASILRWTAEGWLEVTPAILPGSGIALPQGPLDTSSSSAHEEGKRTLAPSVTVHSEVVELDSLSRLKRSFVGAPPLRLAAFRRLIDATQHPYQNASREGAFVRGVGSILSPHSQPMRAETDGARGAALNMTASATESGNWSSVVGSDARLEYAGSRIQASILRRMCHREEITLEQDGEEVFSHWAELHKARLTLRSEGRGDASEGEWAEVQLELIRQERAVVARAYEMRARRGRIAARRHEAFSLEQQARELSRSLQGTGDGRRGIWPSWEDTSTQSTQAKWWEHSEKGDHAEEAVIRDVEGGLRLMPLAASKDDSGDLPMENIVPGRRTSLLSRCWGWIRGRQ